MNPREDVGHGVAGSARQALGGDGARSSRSLTSSPMKPSSSRARPVLRQDHLQVRRLVPTPARGTAGASFAARRRRSRSPRR